MYKRRRRHAGTQWASLQQSPEHIRCSPCSRPLFWPLCCCEQQNTRAHSATKALIRDLASTCASIQARAGAQPANGAHSLVRHDFAMLALNRSRAHTGGVDAQLNQVFAAVEQEKHVSRYPLPISQRRTTRANLPSSPIRTKSPDQRQQPDFQLWDMQGSEHRRLSARDRTFGSTHIQSTPAAGRSGAAALSAAAPSPPPAGPMHSTGRRRRRRRRRRRMGPQPRRRRCGGSGCPGRARTGTQARARTSARGRTHRCTPNAQTRACADGVRMHTRLTRKTDWLWSSCGLGVLGPLLGFRPMQGRGARPAERQPPLANPASRALSVPGEPRTAPRTGHNMARMWRART